MLSAFISCIKNTSTIADQNKGALNYEESGKSPAEGLKIIESTNGMIDRSSLISVSSFGIGYSDESAFKDAVSVYYSVEKGVNFSISKNSLKLNLDYSNIGGLSLNKAAGSNIKKIGNGFFIYEYPYKGVNPYLYSSAGSGSNNMTLKVSMKVNKPFSYIAKLLARGLIKAYEKSARTVNGIIYITSLHYSETENQLLNVDSELLIIEKPTLRKYDE